MPKVESVANISAKTEELSDQEEARLRASFDRSLEDLRSEGTEPILGKLREYYDEVLVAAQIARHELAGSFDGQAPSSGNFGIDMIHPGYFGYDAWDDMPTVTGGSAYDWLDDDTPSNLASGGSGFGNPLKVGDNVVHIILGFGSYASDPVTSRLKEEKNDSPNPAITTEEAFRNTDLRMKFLDTPTILQPDDTYAVRGYAGGEVGETYEEAVYPIGLSFLEAQEYRILDPADMAGTDTGNIVVET